MIDGLRSRRMRRHCGSPLHSRYPIHLGGTLHHWCVSHRRLSLTHLRGEQYHTRQNRLILIGITILEMPVVQQVSLARALEADGSICIVLPHRRIADKRMRWIIEQRWSNGFWVLHVKFWRTREIRCPLGEIIDYMSTASTKVSIGWQC